MKKACESIGIKVESSQLEWVPKNYMALESKDKEESVYKLLEAVEELDDVQNVYANLGN